MVALLIYYKGLQCVPAHISCILELAYPITGLIIDSRINQVSLAPSQYAAAVLLVYCIYKVVDTNRSHRSS
jgi:drug/metabolite transporter (DMT)-like permease